MLEGPAQPLQVYQVTSGTAAACWVLQQQDILGRHRFMTSQSPWVKWGRAEGCAEGLWGQKDVFVRRTLLAW